MGAIYGFTGPPDRRLLEQMGSVLAHRGRQRSVLESAYGSIGVIDGQLAVAQSATRAVRAAGDDVVPSERSLRFAAGDRRLLSVADDEVVTALDGHVLSGHRQQNLAEHFANTGEQVFSELRGGWIAAVLSGGSLYLARDGAGVRTLYFGRHGGRFFFGAEPKAVLAAPGFPRRVRPAAIAQYLSFSFVPGEDTMLEGLFELPAGHHLAVERGEPPRLKRYFYFERTALEDRPEQEWASHIRALHGRAVAERLPKNEPVAVFLSGGLDSSIVTAEVAAQHDRPVKTFAIHFGPEYQNELEFAALVAERFRTEHTEVLVRPKDFLPRLRRIIWHLDDPIGDPITVPNFELAAVARQHAQSVFNGEGGDPLFGGPKNIPMMLQHWYGGIDRGPRFRERAYLESYRRSYEEWPRLLAPDIARQVDPNRDLEDVLTPFFDCDEPETLLNKLCAINIRLKGAHLILPKVERMTAAWGITALAPLFDERLVTASFAMPPTLKLSRGIEKMVLKRAYEGIVPEPVLARPKSGMRVPVRYWFQAELKRYAKKVLSRRALRKTGIFDDRRVKQLMDYDTVEGPGRYGLRLWMLLTFEIWRRIVVEGEAP